MNALSRIPIINLYRNLIVPIQGAVVDTTMTRLIEDVTTRIERDGASGLVIDVSGVEVMDSFMTRNIRDLALTARLMGVHTVVSGLAPSVAIALVEMGLELGVSAGSQQGLVTTLNLERAIEVLDTLKQDEVGTDGFDG